MKYKIFFFILFITIMLGTISNADGGRGMNLINGKIVFTTGGGGIEIADIKDVESTVRDIFKEHIIALEPQFSPDGNDILFTKENPLGWPLSESPQYELMFVDKEGRNPKKVLDMGKTPCGYASWSPDGSKIAFLGGPSLYSPNDSWGELYVASIDGSNIKKVADIKTFACRPSWMPDGKRILFTSKDKKIYSINYDGTDLKEITKGVAPSVSPDGKRIAFRSPWNIYLCNIDGGNKRMLVWNYNRSIFFGNYDYPSELAWSPDSQYLLYSRTSWGTWAGIFSDMIVVSVSNPFKKAKLNYMPGGELQGVSWSRNSR